MTNTLNAIAIILVTVVVLAASGILPIADIQAGQDTVRTGIAGLSDVADLLNNAGK